MTLEGSRVRTRGEGETVPPQPIGHVKYTSPTGKVVDGPDIMSNGHLSEEEQRTWDYTHPGPPFIAGGTFLSRIYRRPGLRPAGGGVFRGGNQILGTTSSPFVGGTVPWSYQYEGGFSDPAPQGYDDAFFSSGFTTDPTHYTSLHPDDLSSSGARAYNRMRPKPESLNLLQSVYELKDVPDMLKTTAGGFANAYKAYIDGSRSGSKARAAALAARQMPKDASDHFLNHQFGWRPFINDLSGLFGLVDRLGVHIANKKRQNNTWIKRYSSEPESNETTVLYSNQSGTISCKPGFSSSGANNYILPNSAKYTITLEKMTRVWYTGVFKYYRVEFDDSYERMHPTLAKQRQVLTSLGYYINPMVVYKVTPWTWLSDWFVNVGDNLQVAQDVIDNSVVSKQVYAMRNITSELKYRQVAELRQGGSLFVEFTRGFETKYRAAGLSPFGFSLLPGGLSPMQLAIVGALGIK